MTHLNQRSSRRWEQFRISLGTKQLFLTQLNISWAVLSGARTFPFPSYIKTLALVRVKGISEMKTSSDATATNLPPNFSA